MILGQIVDDLKDILLEIKGSLELEITSVCCDSRKVQPGSLFVAVKGHKFNGEDFISEAIKMGAVAVAAESPLSLSITSIQVSSSYSALACIAETFHGKPAEKMDLIGVTGTNGKSSTVYMIDALLKGSSYTTGMLGTIQNRIGSRTESAELTTPDALSLQALFVEMLKESVEKVSLEVSSHALSQHRVGSVPFKIAVFTNLTQDHLDYHGNMESYFAAKRKLFDEFLDDSGTAIINIDDQYGKKLFHSCSSKDKVAVGQSSEADFIISDIEQKESGLSFSLTVDENKISFSTHLSGLFNVYNSALAIVSALKSGVSLESIQKSLCTFEGVPGRMEMFKSAQGHRVFVDYAHTPDALEKALAGLKGLGERLICLFGCGGDRDKGKRPLMAQAAEEHADQIWITDDNPRTESSDQILDDIKAGFKTLDKIHVESDRYKAIESAVNFMTAKDVLLVAGKGHEDYQIYGHKKTPFCDRSLVKEILGKISA